jgi:hypothetical protein
MSPTHNEIRRSLIRLPRPLWIGLAATFLIVAAIGLGVGLPIWRQQVAIRDMERMKGIVTTTKGGPEWLRDFLGDERMKTMDDVTEVNLAMAEITDGNLRDVAEFKDLTTLNLARTSVTDAGLELGAVFSDCQPRFAASGNCLQSRRRGSHNREHRRRTIFAGRLASDGLRSPSC